MKRIISIAAILIVAAVGFAQETGRTPAYNQRALQMLGLTQDEINEVLEIQEEAATSVRRLRADQEIRKAELARLLLDENPNMRQIERNLRGAADVEVEIRMVEIRREVEIRQIIGTDRWARLVGALRARQQEAANEISSQATEQLQQLQQAITQKQQELQELIQDGRDVFGDEEIREQFQLLQQQYQELQRMIRSRL